MDQSIFKDVLAGIVHEILPHKSEAQLDDITAFLMDEGVKKESDLRHMTIALLKKVVDTVDASDLYVEWQNKYGSSLPSTSRATTSPHNQRPPLGERNVQTSASAELRTRMPFVDKNSPYIPSKVREAINSKRRPVPSDRQAMVDRIYDHCQENVPNLCRTDFDAVADSLVQLYPDSFKDTLPVSLKGSDSLRKQFRVKFDNENRAAKKNPSSWKKAEAPPIKEAYGCIKWQCNVPEGETEATLSRKQKSLIDMYGNGRRHHYWRRIKSDMEVTFCLQRKDINWPGMEDEKVSRKRKRRTENDEPNDDIDAPDARKTIQDIRAAWPFLFQARGMNIHFRLLTGIDFFVKVENFLSADGKKLINFLTARGDKFAIIRRKMEKYQEKGNTSSPLIAVVRMIQEYFKESLTNFVTYVEETTEFNEVEDTAQAQFPKDGTPFLVVAGEPLYDCSSLFLVLDSTVVATTNDFTEAFVMWFTSYFVFNIVYASALVNSLTYIQKVIAEINPEKGTKCQTQAIQKTANLKANKLHNFFIAFKEQVEVDSAD